MAPESARGASLLIAAAIGAALAGAGAAYGGADQATLGLGLLSAAFGAAAYWRLGETGAVAGSTATLGRKDDAPLALLNALPLGAAVFDASDRLAIENGRWRDLLLRAATGPLVGQGFSALMHLAARTAIDARGREDAWVGERGADFELPTSDVRLPMTDGRILRLTHLTLADGRKLSIVTDTTDEETARASLEAMRQQAVSFLDNIVDAVLVLDERGTVERANAATEAMFGRPRSKIVGQSAAILLDAGQDDAGLRLGNDPGTLVGRLAESRGRRADGSLFPVEIAIGEIGTDWRLVERRAARRRGYVATLRDLTTKKATERQLRQAQKLEAVGTLAGGIAHDFNNLLAIVLGYANLSLADAPAEATELRDSLEAIEAASKRGRDLVRQLLTFSRGGGEARAPLDIAPLVKEAAKLVRATLPPGVALRLAIAETPTTVVGNATQIHQVLVNLSTNAVQAMKDRTGAIEIAVDTVLQDESGQASGELVPGRYIRISVVDDGPGVDPAIADRIFEPFFTTKEVGQGTGLGLAVAHGILKDHGGAIRVESGAGSGSRFEALFPAHDGPIAPEAPRSAPGGETVKAHILVVEDEPALRHVLQRTLARQGYRVTTAENAVDALERLRRSPQGFDAVLTDLAMVGMSGTELAEAARGLGVRAPFVLSTGGRRVPRETAQALGIVAQILKPSIAEDIGETLRLVLRP